MENDPHKNGLYRWQKQAKPKVQSRSYRVTSADDIQDWIKKVEEASTKATDVAFGSAPQSSISGKQRGKLAVQMRSELVRHHESAYSEAQQLLNQWVTDKVRFDDDNGDGYDDLEAWRRARQARLDATSSNNKQNKDSEDFSLERLTQLALDDDIDIDETAIYERVKRNAVGDADPYDNLYDLELPDAVDSVLKTMLNKELVKDTFKKKIGLEEEVRPDPRTKMELRHQMVKENRERRQKEEDKRRQEASRRKEARLTAQKLVLKEQKERDLRAKQEEQLLKKDMARIRKEMHEERRLKEEEMQRKREEKEALERLARAELERQTVEEEREKFALHKQENDRRKKQLLQREMICARIASQNLQCLHRHFTAWYDLVLSRRLMMGKVKAMADWKLMLRVWGAWRSHARGRRIEMEAELHERNVIEAERHKLLADRYYSITILKHCMSAWKHFTLDSLHRKELEEEQQKTKNKMAALLSAVAEGKLGGAGEKGDNTNRSRTTVDESSTSVTSRSVQSSGSQVKAKHQKQTAPISNMTQSNTSTNHSSRSDQTSTSSTKHKSPSSGKGTPIPTEAWQITKQHLNLSPEQIAELGSNAAGDSENTPPSNLEVRKRFGTQPWMPRQFVPNNFEHRYTAQQVALKEQQAQIREQRRLIEELQHEQRQQALRQQLRQGSPAPSLTPPSPYPAQPESPPQGWQIPRDEEEEDTTPPQPDRRPQANNSPNIPKSDTSSFTNMTMPTSVDSFNDRNGSVTDRTDFTAATSATGVSGATQNSKYLKVLKNMEERAAERARLKAEREERRRLQEEEKAAQLQREEEEKQRQVEAEKKAKIEAYKQKKRLEKQREEEKQREQARQQELAHLAETHYNRAILKYRGLLPFKKLISLAKRNWLKAVRHHDKIMLRQCLHAWKQFSEEEMEKKNAIADKMNEFILTKRCFLNWRHYKYHMHFLERRAARHHTEALRQKVFHAWAEGVLSEKEETQRMLAEAKDAYLRNLVRKCFIGWRDLPHRLKREQEKQKRKSDLRKRVAELIPDFTPTETPVPVIASSDDLT